ncbi:hypothetical protein LCGC14_1395120 [marine sediment metagenome]|uniref:Uncharacterized protein n=1 Tax=marine sediment metagenome TaxID=412755 RepID=A0A0F9MEC0_9ZZZZ
MTGNAIDPEDAKRTTPHWDRVRKFMEESSQEVHDEPFMPSISTRLLRARLILEEALETVRALGFTPGLLGVTQGDPMGQPATTMLTISMSGLHLEADREPDLEDIADGCADLSVVNVGTLIACGIKDDALLREVDLNNLAKFKHVCPKCGKDYSDLGNASLEVLAAVQPMTTGRHEPGMWKCTECATEWQSGYRRDDGKWVKPENHKPPDIATVLETQR